MITVDDIIVAGGGQATLARSLGLTGPAVWQWRRAGHIPAERALAVLAALNLEVTRVSIESLPIRWATLPNDSQPAEAVEVRDVPIAA